MQTAKELLLEMLHIIHYKDNKQLFIEEFEAMNHLEAIAHFVTKLPEEFRQKKSFQKEDLQTISQYISPQVYQEEVEQIAQEELKKFAEVVSPVLTLDQKQKITKLLPQ